MPDPRDGDGDGHVYDGKPHERPLGPPPGSTDLAAIPHAPAGDRPYGEIRDWLAAGRPLPAAPSVPRPKLRKFADAGAVREAIYEKALQAAGTIQPVETKYHSLELSDVGYDGPGDFSLLRQKKAILEGGTIERRLKGTWTLKDKATGAVLATKELTLAQIPYLTGRGTFINKGSEYHLGSQMRLRPGVYSRRKSNGELESHVNVMPGGGRSHRIGLDPATGRFGVEFGQANVSLTALLHALGATSPEIRDAWGEDVANTNIAADRGDSLAKLYAKIARPGDPMPPDLATAVRDAFTRMRLDPEVTARTLGLGHEGVTKDTLLAASKKLLAINRGEAEPDDRDALAYMTVHGPEDLIAERIAKVKEPIRKALWRAGRDGNLDHMPSGVLSQAVRGALLDSGLGSPGELINPMMILDQRGRTSRLGQGGISSVDSVPQESRELQPSHLGFLDSVITPESMRAGIDLRAASGVLKGDDGRIYAQFRDARTGQVEYKSPGSLADKVIAFPGELDRQDRLAAALALPDPAARQAAIAALGPAGWNDQGRSIRAQGDVRRGARKVAAIKGGKLVMVSPHEVDYELPGYERGFSSVANLIPMKSAIKPGRASMGARMTTQALPLVNAESPHVRSGIPGNPTRSFEQELGGEAGAIRSTAGGRVVKIEPNRVVVRGPDGKNVEHELHYHHALNRKTGLHQVPAVRVGDEVQPGQLLARSNFTDAEGTTALGANVRVAYMSHGGFNFEDAVVMSESAAKDRFASDHYYQHEIEHADGVVVGKHEHTALFAGKHDRATLAKFGDDGVIKVGTTVKPDDPLILAAKKRDRTYGSIHAGRKPSYTDASQTWDHHTDGVVTDAVRTRKGTLVVVHTKVPSEVGDKFSGRYGDKGVLAKIIPDDQMPRDPQGRPYELLLNPLGIVSRTNPAQMIEAALGKIVADKTGQPYNVPDWEGRDHLEFARQELAKHGMSDTEDVLDPTTGRTIKNIFAGNRFIMKLHHTSAGKVGARSTGGYTADGSPSRGGASGSKRLSLGDTNALLSHGATSFLRDAATRGQDSARYWQQVMSGHTPPQNEASPGYEQFHEMLRAAGLNPKREGTRTSLLALTDKDVDALAGEREIGNAETVDWKAGQRPIRGGLFDPALTGGNTGTRWSALRLHEPMPNPAFEEPARRMLGMTRSQFRETLAGHREIEKHGTGPGAIADALAAIDIPKEIERARREIKGTRAGDRDLAIRRLGYLKAAEANDLHPKDWVLKRAPILPPKFRPVSIMQGSGLPMIADPNLLYKELHDANANLRDMKGRVADVGEERLALYDAFRGVVGLGEPTHPKNREREVTGILKKVFGEGGPKTSVVQRKLLSSAVDMVGRAVISPDPTLDIDQVGLPEAHAWETYKPFVVRRLVRNGIDRLRAARMVADRDPVARKALEAEIEVRPVVAGRAPTLHRYSMMAFRPVLTAGDTLRLPPLVYKGYGADNDGDMMTWHTPSSDDAVQEAYDKMLPSKNLLNTSDFAAHQLPTQELVAGLYSASTDKSDKMRPRTLASVADVFRAWTRGEVELGDQVDVADEG